MYVPAGHQRIRVLKELEHAREVFKPGDVLVLDNASADRLVKSKSAERLAPEPARAMIAATCPKCGAAMEYVADPAPSERWTQCKNATCNFGWMR